MGQSSPEMVSGFLLGAFPGHTLRGWISPCYSSSVAPSAWKPSVHPKLLLLQRLTLLFQRLTLSRNYLKPLRGVLRKQILKTTLITSLPGPLGLRWGGTRTSYTSSLTQAVFMPSVCLPGRCGRLAVLGSGLAVSCHQYLGSLATTTITCSLVLLQGLGTLGQIILLRIR